jgi:hypothetical protein
VHILRFGANHREFPQQLPVHVEQRGQLDLKLSDDGGRVLLRGRPRGRCRRLRAPLLHHGFQIAHLPREVLHAFLQPLPLFYRFSRAKGARLVNRDDAAKVCHAGERLAAGDAARSAAQRRERGFEGRGRALLARARKRLAGRVSAAAAAAAARAATAAPRRRRLRLAQRRR